MRIAEAGLDFRARIDTGAAASSVHALEIEVDGPRAHFTLENERGERRRLRAPILDFAEVRSAQATERRPRVALHLLLAGVERRVPVSLRDRSHMRHKLLVGRDFLAGAFVVDAARGAPEAPLD